MKGYGWVHKDPQYFNSMEKTMIQNETHQAQLHVNSTKESSAVGRSKATSTSTATQTAYTPKKPVGKMVFFGALSLGAYLLLFSKETLVTQTYTLGGWHAAFPVLTAFLFSFVHGAFASNFLSVLGLEAKSSH